MAAKGLVSTAQLTLTLHALRLILERLQEFTGITTRCQQDTAVSRKGTRDGEADERHRGDAHVRSQTRRAPYLFCVLERRVCGAGPAQNGRRL